jgi:hypothetical protein
VERLRARWIATAVLLVCAAVVTVTSVVAWYGQDALLDGDRWVEAVGPLLDDPEVRAAVATEITDTVIEAADLERRLEQLLGEQSGPLADLARGLVGPIPERVREVLEPVVRDVLARPEVRNAWRAANEDGHAAVVALLRGETELVRIVGQELRLDAGPVVAFAAEQLAQRGGTFGALVAPLLPRDIDRDIVLASSPEFPRAQETLDRLERLVVVAPIVALVLLGAGIALAPRRAQAAAGALVGTAVIGVVTWAWMRTAGEEGIEFTALDPSGGVQGAFDALVALLRTLELWVDRLWAVTIWVPVAGAALAAAVLVSSRSASTTQPDAPPP